LFQILPGSLSAIRAFEKLYPHLNYAIFSLAGHFCGQSHPSLVGYGGIYSDLAIAPTLTA